MDIKAHEKSDREKLQFLPLGNVGVFLVCTVQPGHRIRLPADASKHIPWLKDGPRTAKLYLGMKGGAQLWRQGRPFEDEIRSIEEAVNVNPIRAAESATKWMDLVRTTPGCDVEFKVAPGRYLLVLPRDFRKMGVLPNAGKKAAVVICGEIIEIWDVEDWYKHVKATFTTYISETDTLEDELDERV